MRAAPLQTSAYSNATSPRRRGVALTLVVVIHVLLLLMLLRLAPPEWIQPKPSHGAITLTLQPEKRPEPTKTHAAKAKRSTSAAARQRSATRIPKPIVPPTVRTKTLSSSAAEIWSHVVPLTREEYAASDVAKMPSHDKGSSGKEGDTEGDGADGGGGGANGERLYNADWYRKPTDAELATYIPHNAPRVGWGEIACRTVPDNRVEDCHELGQSPGSGYGRAVLNAAWQFRVMPPRIGNRPMVGAWVRIRIDYTERGAIER